MSRIEAMARHKKRIVKKQRKKKTVKEMILRMRIHHKTVMEAGAMMMRHAQRSPQSLSHWSLAGFP